jgi:uncharacterized RDD family membrane protein YckC
MNNETQTDDIYQPPKSDTNIETESELKRVGKGVRFLNYIIDYVIQVVAIVGITELVLISGNEKIYQTFQNTPDLLFGSIVTLIYYLSMEMSLGRTVGKMVTGTKVVNEDGNTASAGQILGRTFCRFVPFEAFSFLGEEVRGWHDSWSNTYVVRSR